MNDLNANTQTQANQICKITDELIETVTGIHINNFESIQILDLNIKSYEKIFKIENLFHLVNLLQLNLSFNCIDRIENISHLTQLVELNLAENRIYRVSIVYCHDFIFHAFY